MAKLVWDTTGEHYYSTGVSDVILFVQKSDGTYDTGVAWNGVTSIEENPDGGDANDFYADNIKYLSLRAAENYGATINAYQSPEEFDQCDGIASLLTGVKIGQQVRKPFGLVYKSLLGNDTQGTDYGYELHIIYNATCSPSSKTYETVNDSPEPAELSWEIETVPVNVKGFKPTSTIVVNSTQIDSGKLKTLIDTLYGVNADSSVAPAIEESDPTLPNPDDIVTLLGGN